MPVAERQIIEAGLLRASGVQQDTRLARRAEALNRAVGEADANDTGTRLAIVHPSGRIARDVARAKRARQQLGPLPERCHRGLMVDADVLRWPEFLEAAPQAVRRRRIMIAGQQVPLDLGELAEAGREPST